MTLLPNNEFQSNAVSPELITILDLSINLSSSSFSIQRFLSHRKICITAKVIVSRNFTIKYYKKTWSKQYLASHCGKLQEIECKNARAILRFVTATCNYSVHTILVFELSFILLTYTSDVNLKIKDQNQKLGNDTR